jgi:hypothetical protein
MEQRGYEPSNHTKNKRKTGHNSSINHLDTPVGLLVGSSAVAPLPSVVVVVMGNHRRADGLLENRGRNLSGIPGVLVC